MITPSGRLTLRARVALNVVAVTALIQLVLGLVVYIAFQSTIDNFFNDRLRGRLRQAVHDVTAAEDPTAHATLANSTEQSLRMVTFATLVLTVQDQTGRVLGCSHERVDLRNLPVPPPLAEGEFKAFLVPIPGIGTGDDDKIPARAVTVPITTRDGRHLFLTGAIADTAGHDISRYIGRAVLIASLLGLGATGWSSWYITGLSLKPLSQLGSVAQRFRLDRLSEPSDPVRDIPEFNSLSTELDAARERIRVALQANERFIANVSHELKTPVAVMHTQAQTLDVSRLTPETSAFIASVVEETGRLGGMVDSFLTLSSVRSGQALATTQPVYVNDLIIDTVTHCTAVAKQNGVSIVAKLDEGDEDVVVAGNPDLLSVLIDNLLRNAVRFSPAGSTVRAVVEADATHATLSITDQGPGIPPELLPKLFERFTQSSDEAARGRGHGLGLSIAQGIAELHGGVITAENLPVPPGGCRFTVRLPRTRP